MNKAIYHAAQGFLARREHSKLELIQKLSRKDFGLCSISAVIDLLEEQGFQSNQRFAESCLRSRVRQGYGPNYIHQLLIQKGVDEAVIDEVFAASDLNWFECIENVWHKKYDALPDKLKEIAKQKRFLYYRGFTSELINQLFNELN